MKKCFWDMKGSGGEVYLSRSRSLGRSRKLLSILKCGPGREDYGQVGQTDCSRKGRCEVGQWWPGAGNIKPADTLDMGKTPTLKRE